MLSEDVSQIVMNDLEQVGEFLVRCLRSNMLSLPSDESREVYYRDWRILAQDYLLVGKIDRAPGSQLVQVQYEFFDINREIKLAGEVLTGSVTQLRDIAHEISNVVFRTGYRDTWRLYHRDNVRGCGVHVNPELNLFPPREI